MIKSLIYFLIVSNIGIAISLEAGKFIFDVENTFDNDNNEFNIENNSDESENYLIIINTKSELYYRYDCSITPGRIMISMGSFALI